MSLAQPPNAIKKRKLSDYAKFENEEVENAEPNKKLHVTTDVIQSKSLLKNVPQAMAVTVQKPENEENWDDEIAFAQETGQVNQGTAVVKPFETCLIGTSMVKHIRPVDLFGKRKCFFKSISGGLIKHIDSFLRTREGYFESCNMFVVTCGSNDCDSKNEISETLTAYLDLCLYLSEKYPNARLILNTLVPRQNTRFTTQEEFEERRVLFNQFLNSSVNSLIWNARIVSHPNFENRESLSTLLSDGVHLSVDQGVLIYVQEIKTVLNDLKFDLEAVSSS